MPSARLAQDKAAPENDNLAYAPLIMAQLTKPGHFR